MAGKQAYMRRAAATERMVDEAVAAVNAERRAQHEAAKVERAEREAARHRYGRVELLGAYAVHDGRSWRKVVRVNAKTVSVVNAIMAHWEPQRIPFDKVHNVLMHEPKAAS